MTTHESSHRVRKTFRRRAAATLSLVMLAGTVALSAVAPSASASFQYGVDSATTWVYCDPVSHQVWLRSTATYYNSSVTRQVLASWGSGWRVASPWRIPDNQWIGIDLRAMAGYRLAWYVQYSYTSASGEYPSTYQWNGYTKQWVQQASSSCLV